MLMEKRKRMELSFKHHTLLCLEFLLHKEKSWDLNLRKEA